jgi:hypothetical protein
MAVDLVPKISLDAEPTMFKKLFDAEECGGATDYLFSLVVVLTRSAARLPIAAPAAGSGCNRRRPQIWMWERLITVVSLPSSLRTLPPEIERETEQVRAKNE